MVPGDRRPAGIRVHRPTTLHRRDLRSQHGIRVTSPARTLLDVAPRLSDKQRTRAVNNALHSTYLKLSQLEDLLVRVPTHPAAALLKPFIDDQSAPTRSTLEDDFVQFCERFDLPTPQTNVLIGGYLVDAYFPSHRLIVELDSWSFHSTRTDFEIDRNRDADHLTDGIPTIRITHQRITNKPDAEAARLHKILASRE